MQATVRDDRARRFARDFYESLADGAAIDAAILDARRLVRQGADGSAADIGIPVCYLRSESTTLIEAPQQVPAAAIPARTNLPGTRAKALIGVAATAILGAGLVLSRGFSTIGATASPSAAPAASPAQAPSAIPSGISDARVVTSPSLSPTAVVPQVSITAATVTSVADEISYEVEGVAFGITDPPWKVFVIARPKVANATDTTASQWWVSTEVIPTADGRWTATLVADVLPPRSQGVRFEPVLVSSPEPLPTPTLPPPEPTLKPGQTPPPPTPPAVDTTASIEQILSEEGPTSEVVERTFGVFDLPTP
jgi:hypothetical protein